MSSNSAFSIEKLTGRDNYANWKFAVKAYLEHEDLWTCISGQTVDTAKDVKAKSKLILLVDAINYVHIQDATTSKEVWSNLERAFDDNGLSRKVALLKDLITTTLESSRSVEEYVNKIMTSAHKLRNIGFSVDDEWLGTLMLAGLPDLYKPMIMAIESSGVKISADHIKTKLLQEVQSSETTAFYSFKNKTNEKQHHVKPKGPRCYNCNRYGHIGKNCRIQKKTSSNNGDKGFVAAFSASSVTIGNDKWYVDSGASMHMTNTRDWMYDVKHPPISTITVANNTNLPVEGVGKVNLILDGNNANRIQVCNVLYVPKLAGNLLSVSAMVKNGCKVNFSKGNCEIINNKGDFVCNAVLENNLYILKVDRDIKANLSISEISNDVVLWHRRMGHLNFSDVNRLPECTEGVSLTSDKKKLPVICTTCLKGKQSRLPFNHTGSRASELLEVIHSDLCGPMEIPSLGGMKYFLTFVDDYSRSVYVYFLKDKLTVLNAFKDFHKKTENECNKKIKIVRTDGGLEYCNKDFDSYLSQHGIKHQTSTPYSPQQNGLAERMNRTLLERAKCMLSDADLPKPFWAEATATAAYVINRSPTAAINRKTPYELWTGNRPDLSNLRIFGSEVMMQVPKEKRKKWDPKSKKMIFVGYCDNTKGYRLAEPKTNRIIKSRDVQFLENVKNKNDIYLPCDVNSSIEEVQLAPSVRAPDSGTVKLLESADANSSETSDEYETDIDQDESYVPPISSQELPQSTITLRPRNRPHKNEENSQPSYFCPVGNLRDPDSVKEALSSENAENWKLAMDDEFQSLLKNNTWKLTTLPPGKKALPCKWIFKTKIDETGAVNRYKARLVVKGYAQKRGIDYDEIYSPVVRYTSVRYLIALAARYDLEIEQMDAITAFLQGDLENEIYMVQPESYEEGTKVCLLQKSIYGLKQASRQWNVKLDSVLQKIGLTRSRIDPCIYYCIKKSTMMFVAVWVDDLIIFSNNCDLKCEVKEQLKGEFHMKDLGEAKQFIGLNISRKRKEGKIMLDQEMYVKEILNRFGMLESKPVKTPIEVNVKFDSDDTHNNDDIPYRQAIGCLLYLAQATRPDIGFAVNKLSRYVSNPSHQHWLGVKRIMRYLQGTKDYKLCFTKDTTNKITGFCDSDWASSPEDRRSCTGYIFIFQNGAIAWNSCKQSTVALSTAEAEYMAMSAATQEALWLRQLQQELGLYNDCPLLIHSDNQSAISLASVDCYKPKTKHIDIRFHFLRDNVNNKNVNFIYCKGSEMVADILTKGTSLDKHLFCIKKMGLHSRGGVE